VLKCISSYFNKVSYFLESRTVRKLRHFFWIQNSNRDALFTIRLELSVKLISTEWWCSKLKAVLQFQYQTVALYLAILLRAQFSARLIGMQRVSTCPIELSRLFPSPSACKFKTLWKYQFVCTWFMSGEWVCSLELDLVPHWSNFSGHNIVRSSVNFTSNTNFILRQFTASPNYMCRVKHRTCEIWRKLHTKFPVQITELRKILLWWAYE
jgi:hypothetical protein